mmetsp:Transcript_20227/g.43978  ORF Transcript_20227/g.43978 Transcript_20227/m.43978 type:complete len:277 (+) Transcript_20227:791-1621(+)
MVLETCDTRLSGFGSSSVAEAVNERFNDAALAANIRTASLTSSYEHWDKSSFLSIGGDGRLSMGVKNASKPIAVKFLKPFSCNARRFPFTLHRRMLAKISSVNSGLPLRSMPSNEPLSIESRTIETTSSSTASISFSFKLFKLRRASDEAPNESKASLVRGIFCNDNSNRHPLTPPSAKDEKCSPTAWQSCVPIKGHAVRSIDERVREDAPIILAISSSFKRYAPPKEIANRFSSSLLISVITCTAWLPKHLPQCLSKIARNPDGSNTRRASQNCS